MLTEPSCETESKFCSMLTTILPFSFPLPSSASFPFLHCLALLSSLLLHRLNSSSLLPSTFFLLPLPPFSPGSGAFPSLHWLPLYLQGTNRTARTGEGTCKNKQVVRRQHPQSCSRLSLLQVRVDTGIVEGSTISMYYDPMISKVHCTRIMKEQRSPFLRPPT